MFDPDADEDVAALDTLDVPAGTSTTPVERLLPFFRPEPWIMGILNVTPDSFSDGGRWVSTEAAVERGLRLVADGAHLVDVGGESTRPGAHRVDAQEEAARVVPVIEALTAQDVQCSVDTTRSEVAAAALAAGAVLVNDVSGGLADPDMVDLVADRGCPWILMHWRGHSTDMDRLAHYRDVAGEVVGELAGQVEVALAHGVDERLLILDPGLGFAKNAAHNWELLHELDRLVQLGLPVLVGASRKRFLGVLLADGGDPTPDLTLDGTTERPVFERSGSPRPVAEREFATAAISQIAAAAGVWGVRVHEPRPTADVFAVQQALAAFRSADQRRDRRASTDWTGEPWPDRPLGPASAVDLEPWWRPLRTGRWLPPEPADPDAARQRPAEHDRGSRRQSGSDGGPRG